MMAPRLDGLFWTGVFVSGPPQVGNVGLPGSIDGGDGGTQAQVNLQINPK
jgi:hypothetical protein